MPEYPCGRRPPVHWYSCWHQRTAPPHAGQETVVYCVILGQHTAPPHAGQEIVVY